MGRKAATGFCRCNAMYSMAMATMVLLVVVVVMVVVVDGGVATGGD
jgi:hypothetical protein